jgi:dolichol-phosphate mannosyltransferase
MGQGGEPVELSICAPMWSEEAVLGEFVQRCAEAASRCTPAFELLIVDDGSSDGTWARLRELAREKLFLRGVRHSRNFGLQAAVTTALENARGQAVVLIDGDLEDPPELIPDLYRLWKDGAEVVYTVKTERKVGLVRRMLFRAFHWIFSKLASPPMPAQAGLFCLLDRRAVAWINRLPERVRYLPGLRAWVGFRQKELKYCRDRRYDTRPRQSHMRLFQLACTGITSFSSIPLQIGLGVGFATMLLSILAICIIVYVRLFTTLSAPGWATYTTILAGLGGFLTFYLSIIGSYLGHVYLEVKRRPHGIVEDEF